MPLDLTTWKVTETPAAEPDVFSLETFAAWLEKQPPDTAYNYMDVENCLLCRYGRAMGLSVESAGNDYLRIGTPLVNRIQKVEGAGYITLANTYGEARERARTLLAARKLLAERNG